MDRCYSYDSYNTETEQCEATELHTPLSLQEILKLRGYVVMSSMDEYSVGDVVEDAWDLKSQMIHKIVVVATTTFYDFAQQCRLAEVLPFNGHKYFYRAAIE